ncbi:MAG: sigma-70 family RNA polymerase sigma factor [Clostridiales bacterium]|nr:sigma-70 family RNA polymerase sigma factor [Clostridiales bacterium]
MDKGSSMQEIYQEYARPVYLYLQSLCHDEKLAEDLTQETFYRAVKSIHRFHGECRLVTWLCQIGKHLWYQELEKRKKRGTTLPLDENQPDASPGLHAAMESDEGKISLFQAMQHLDATAREIMYLRVMGDLSFRQIGEILGGTENWARVTFYRAKEKLRKEWNQDE